MFKAGDKVRIVNFDKVKADYPEASVLQLKEYSEELVVEDYMNDVKEVPGILLIINMIEVYKGEKQVKVIIPSRTENTAENTRNFLITESVLELRE